MTEVEKIQNYTNGEKPKSDHSIIRVKNISNPQQKLELFKEVLKTILNNKSLNEEDPKWEQLLPPAIVKFTNQLTEDDYYNDVLVTHIPNIIDWITDIRKWEWYSSKVTANGFEVFVTGKLNGLTVDGLLHHLGIPHKSIFIEKEGKEYGIKGGAIDVLTYRNWNPDTLVLSPGKAKR